MLRARAGDADGVALLERVGTDRGGGTWPVMHDHRDRVHVGVHQRGDDVGGRRARRDHGDAGLAGDVGIPLGHVAGTLLVTHEHVADRRIDDRVVNRQNCAAGKAKHYLDTLALEGPDEGFAAIGGIGAHET